MIELQKRKGTNYKTLESKISQLKDNKEVINFFSNYINDYIKLDDKYYVVND